MEKQKPTLKVDTVFLKVSFRIPGTPPSVNNAWRASAHGVFYKSKQYKDWEITVAKCALTQQRRSEMLLLKGRMYRLLITAFAPTWFHKNGSVKKPDTPNLIKSAEDAVCRLYGWEDHLNIETTVLKAEDPAAEAPYTVIDFSFL